MKLITGKIMCDIDGCSSTNEQCKITTYADGTHLCEYHTYLDGKMGLAKRVEHKKYHWVYTNKRPTKRLPNWLNLIRNNDTVSS